jgi:hypothetical protein
LALVKICLIAGMKLLFQLSQRNFFVKTIGKNVARFCKRTLVPGH